MEKAKIRIEYNPKEDSMAEKLMNLAKETSSGIEIFMRGGRTHSKSFTSVQYLKRLIEEESERGKLKVLVMGGDIGVANKIVKSLILTDCKIIPINSISLEVERKMENSLDFRNETRDILISHELEPDIFILKDYDREFNLPPNINYQDRSKPISGIVDRRSKKGKSNPNLGSNFHK